MSSIEWKSLEAVPVMLTSNVVKATHNEFIAVHRTLGVFKYNTNDNKWNLFARFPFDYESKKGEILIDHTNNTLFIANAYEGYMIVFDLNSKIFTKVHHQLFDLVGHSIKLIMMNKKMSAIWDNYYINEWNNGTFDPLIYTDELEFEDVVDRKVAMYSCYGMEWLHSKQSLMILGGTIISGPNSKGIDNIYLYKPTELKMVKTTYKLPTPLCQFGHFLTRDEKHLVLFGGKTGMIFGHWIDDIFVLNTEIMSITKSKIKCPEKGLFDVVYRYDEEREEIITFGFIRECWKNESFSGIEYPPFYIVEFIKLWFVEEFIHLFAKTVTFNQRNHFQINLDHILNFNL